MIVCLSHTDINISEINAVRNSVVGATPQTPFIPNNLGSKKIQANNITNPLATDITVATAAFPIAVK